MVYIAQTQDGCLIALLGKSDTLEVLLWESLRITDVQHCNMHRGVGFLPSLCSSETNEQMKACMVLIGWVDIHTVLVTVTKNHP